MTWRVGRKVGRTIYDGDTDTLIGMMDSAWLARRAVDGVNALAEVAALRTQNAALVEALEGLLKTPLGRTDERNQAIARAEVALRGAGRG